MELLQTYREQERVIREQILNREGDEKELNAQLNHVRQQIEIVSNKFN